MSLSDSIIAQNQDAPRPGRVYSLSAIAEGKTWEDSRLTYELPRLGQHLRFIGGHGCAKHEGVCIGFAEFDRTHAIVIDENLKRHNVDSLHRDEISPIGWYATENSDASPAEISDITERFTNSELLRNEDEATQKRSKQEKIAKGREVAAKFFTQDVKAVIVAVYERDVSDSMTDYFATKAIRRIVLATSSHTRSVFSELRKAAKRHAETEHLASSDSIEHRETYSMGKGVYLSGSDISYATGWIVRKQVWNFRDDQDLLLSLAEEHALG